MKIAALIPAYNPGWVLADLVPALAASGFAHIIIVNDGSSESCDPIFERLKPMEKVDLLKHAVNLGKGAALKTGLNYAYCRYGKDIGVVTIDADGQHLPEDAQKVGLALSRNPGRLVMGVRSFGGGVPMRSRLGNTLTRYLFAALIGRKLSDTQTGLRGIPGEFIPKLLKIDSNGYEFELDMLLACKYTARPIVEEGISTVYIDGNKSSHFNPLVDSMRIYFVLLRFALAAMLTALIDYTVFFLTYGASASILASQASGRAVALLFNYSAVRRAVFYSDLKHSRTFPRYLALVLFSGTVSYLLIRFLTAFTQLGVMPSKVLVESVIFLANFAVQRDFIFTRSKKG